jgi:hypothetical protein
MLQCYNVAFLGAFLGRVKVDWDAAFDGAND